MTKGTIGILTGFAMWRLRTPTIPVAAIEAEKGRLTMHSLTIENLSVAAELDAKAMATICGGTSIREMPHAAMSGSLTSIGAGAVATADAPEAPSESVSFNYGSLQVVYSPQHAD